ncbi:Ig-like domain-containing protein [Maribacter sp. Asnod1-A12]|uniref:Ig-like domain-containing protein n=1 Tax=Maribacter sp. Asnod1-A12 TaxID=3160576 RepID=UPI00386D26D3
MGKITLILRNFFSFKSCIFLATLLLTFSFSTSDKLEAELFDFYAVDTDGDGIYDSDDIDDDGDGIIDSNEDKNLDGDNDPSTNSNDTDGDGFPDYLDLDSDNDGILDNIEAQKAMLILSPSGMDVDGNGLDDVYELSPGSGEGLIAIDTDGDNVFDYLDFDSDNDGILDSNESSEIGNDFNCDVAPTLSFNNVPTLESGSGFNEGAVYRFSNVTDNLDALVTIEQIVNGRISTLDQNSVDPDFFKPEIEFTTSDEVRRPFVDLRISMVNTGTNDITFVDELIANFIDVDGNTQYQEFNRFDTPASYTFDTPSDVGVVFTAGGLLINGGMREYDGISNANPSVNVAVEFVNISTFVFRFGIETETSDNFTTAVPRQSGIQFSCLDNFISPQTVSFSKDIDSDGDGYPDRVDIDSDNDGIPDNVEAQVTDGYISPTGLDDDGDGLDNAYDNGDFEGLSPVNTDGTDEDDYLDDDSDNDLVPDSNEGNDFDFDGVPDQTYTGVDTDGDGLDDGYEGSDVNDGFDVNDEIDDPANDLPDTDGTEDVNYRDLDDDGDGVDTPDEDVDNDGDPTNDDSDNDGTPDYLDPDTVPMQDLDAIDDIVSTPINTPIEIDILDNDFGIPSDGTLTVTDPSNGTVEINDGGTPDDISDDTITYTPNDGFEGTETIEYTVCDAEGNCDTATVTITVGEPVALDVVDDSVSTPVDTPIEITILDNDFGIPTDGTLTVTDPSNGTVEINDGGTPDDISDDTIIYTPNGGFEGTDIIEYTVCDAEGNCDTATVEISVINDNPVDPDDTVIEVNQMVTPNGDGKNEFLFIRGVDKISHSTLKIFNRWGVAVYEGENYNNQNNVFDGRSRGRSTLGVDEYLPAGIYFYIFDYTTFEGVNNVDSEYLYISR